MEIFINGKSADITLNTEKTIGEVLAGIEQWLSPGGNRIKTISLDGENIPVEDLGPVFNRDLSDFKKLDITVGSFRELAAEAMLQLSDICDIFLDASFEDRKKIIESWEQSPVYYFMTASLPDVYEMASQSFAGKGFTPQNLLIILKERLREIIDPQKELAAAEPLVRIISRRMEQLPLDMQTGKDEAAAETINLFSKMGEKLFRFLFIFKSEGLLLDNFSISGMNIKDFMDAFHKSLTEISDAYRDKDTVLAGDIAEYELAPKILEFFEALKEIKILAIKDITYS